MKILQIEVGSNALRNEQRRRMKIFQVKKCIDRFAKCLFRPTLDSCLHQPAHLQEESLALKSLHAKSLYQQMALVSYVMEEAVDATLPLQELSSTQSATLPGDVRTHLHGNERALEAADNL